jgi:hypothetical protein
MAQGLIARRQTPTPLEEEDWQANRPFDGALPATDFLCLCLTHLRFALRRKSSRSANIKELFMRDPSDKPTMRDDKDSRPVAKGVGAAVGGVTGGVAGGAAAGATVGGVTGPVGAAAGAVIGAVAGAMAGKALAKAVDPAAEDSYWRDNYSSRPYVRSNAPYDDYAPAYRYGVDSYSRYSDRRFDEVEPELSRDWGQARGRSSLEWDDARHATRDAWQRLSDTVERATPGDSDRDGR